MKTANIIQRPAPLDWDVLESLPITQLYWSEPVDIFAKAKICYDNTAIYIQLSAKEKHIRAEHTGALGMPCEDSCLEFFFAPDEKDRRYLNFEFNPNACMYLGIGSSIRDLVRILPEDTTLFQPCVEQTQEGWKITFLIPVSFIRFFFPDFTASPGRRVRGNFYKCGDKTEVPHFLSWSELSSPVPDFHRSCDFGELYFE